MIGADFLDALDVIGKREDMKDASDEQVATEAAKAVGLRTKIETLEDENIGEQGQTGSRYFTNESATFHKNVKEIERLKRVQKSRGLPERDNQRETYTDEETGYVYEKLSPGKWKRIK